MSFVVPDGSTDGVAVARTLDAIHSALAAQGVALRVNETPFSRSDALQSHDVRPLVPDGASEMVFYELCVPTHHYWKASTITEDVLDGLHKISGEG
jgi:hypothetical protein